MFVFHRGSISTRQACFLIAFIKYACGSEAAAEVITNCGMPVVQTVAANWGEGVIPNTEISRQLFVDVMADSKQTILGGSFNEMRILRALLPMLLSISPLAGSRGSTTKSRLYGARATAIQMTITSS